MSTESVGAVVIGRNEGDRLVTCLTSLRGHADPVVYVDSGSTDGSVARALDLGVSVVDLDMSTKFTAARARNAGLERLSELDPNGTFVQFVDGDCEVDRNWIDVAVSAIQSDRELAVVCGRRRERHPKASIFNAMIDQEWDTPVGPAKSCGGDALMRRHAVDAVGGFDPAFIAGEEPELCFRLRQAGWKIERLDAEMTLHDAALTNLTQWWTRARRGGYAYGLLSARHGQPPERLRVKERRRALIWGFGIPVLAVVGSLLVTPSSLMLLGLWPLNVLRQFQNGTPPVEALFLLAAKVPEAIGVLEHELRRLNGRDRGLIEYK